MGTFKVLVVDDERFAREELIFLLENFPESKVIAEAERGEAAILKAIQLQPDVVFLDIEMPKMDGIEVAKSLLELKKSPLIVFATAYPQFAAEAFRINAVDYLLKPYDIDQLTQAMERIRNIMFPVKSAPHSTPLGKLAVEKDGEIDYVFISDILYLSPDGKTTMIKTRKNEYVVKSSLKELENRLIPFSFFRIHRSFLVNLTYVTRLTPWFNGAYQLELEGEGDKLPVSRNYVKDLRERLEL
ncbi:LytR/AlgR family response regulator transcription factor [Pseudogracilibacillus auburnensis]|uniref:LytTR family two component transcriptional regulator n=1 Tax=Pseudogracilibacillus auburnensis TaxID=1494959 RepID=A0A2V3VNP4_9BACI|nr:LytTR family DNA-binding domain-containing protein [Pseudogracilibacillus auburnensis]PXW82438.1 LytTR family two component transcriptional regulator [Pseudogracilibacillus auburnensis]